MTTGIYAYWDNENNYYAYIKEVMEGVGLN